MKNKLFKLSNLIITPILILLLLVISLNYESLASNYDNTKLACSLNNISSTPQKIYNSNVHKNTFCKNSQDIELIPGGDSVGVKLSCRGILVVGFCDGKCEAHINNSSIVIGDIITEVNHETVCTSKDLIKKVKDSKEDEITLTIIRKDEEVSTKVHLTKDDNGDKRIGLWIRDTTAGVGTMTFYDKETGKFGALGHPVIDSDTNECFKIKEGSLLKSSIISVRKGEKGNPGELKGIFIDDDSPLALIESNTECGIFGTINNYPIKDREALKVASRDEIKEGPAKILTTIDGDGPKEYSIEIQKLFTQNDPGAKSMIIKVTDTKLLETTGGIVQGMSGSPIIQNDKIVGAVTHVLINKPDTGYGIYIDWMLNEVGIN